MDLTNYTTGEAKVTHEGGLHARPSAIITTVCFREEKKIYLENLGNKTNEEERYKDAKGIMEIITLKAVQGTTIRIYVEGQDELAREICHRLQRIIGAEDLEDMAREASS